MTFEETLQTIHVTPKSEAGARVATINLLVESTTLNNGSRLYLYKSDGYFISRNNSVRSYHTNHPTFRLIPSVSSSLPTESSSYHLNFNSTALAQLRALSTEYCTINSTSYINISLDLILLSSSLYHLGDHTIYVDGSLVSNDRYYHFITILSLRVQAGNHNHL